MADEPKNPADMSDRELIAEWECIDCDSEDTARTEANGFMQCASTQPAPAKPRIQLGKSEWDDPMIGHGKGHRP